MDRQHNGDSIPRNSTFEIHFDYLTHVLVYWVIFHSNRNKDKNQFRTSLINHGLANSESIKQI